MDAQLWETRLKDWLNDDFENRNDYTGGSLLSLYWEDAEDSGYKDESEKVVHFFATMGFDATAFPIPSENSHVELLSRVIELIKSQGKPGNLVVIHYGGHGDADNDRGMDRESLAVWAAQLEGGPILDWYEIQPQLHKCKADILLLLDCCYSAQAARSRAREDPGKCELLAACAMRLQTPPPGPSSFTTALLKEMNSMLEITGKILIDQVVRGLSTQRAGLRQTPIHVNMSRGHEGRCIRWKPFSSARQPFSHPSGPTSQLKLRVTVPADIISQEKSLRELVQWLKTEAPPDVRKVAVDEVVLQAEQLQQIIQGQDSIVNKSPLVESSGAPAREEILNAWKQVDGLLTNVSQSWSPTVELHSFEEVARLKERILHFIQELELRNSIVTRTIETEVLAMSDGIREEVLNSSAAKLLRIDAPLQLRSLIRSSEIASRSLEIDAHEIKPINGKQESTALEAKAKGRTLNEVEVLVEYKPYGLVENEAWTIRDKMKAEKLAQILSSSKPAELLSLNCLHWFHDSYERHYGLVFEIPSELSLPVTTLFELIKTTHRETRPTLGQRFRMAYDIGRAVQRWHSIGWVHEEICSRNILIFRNAETQVYDFSKPFLGGFRYSRREVDFSAGHGVEDLRSNIYRHPTRQGGIPLQRHDRLHDIYAYGILLLEIGLWQVALDHRYFQTALRGEKTLGPEEIRKLLIKIAKQSLGHFMGAEYRDAAVVCLEDGLGNDLEDEYRTQPELARAFRARVLDQVARGLGLS